MEIFFLQSSTGVYGLQKRMVHSIASLVNPHAKLAETEAKRAEQEYYQSQSATRRPATTSGSKLSGNTLSKYILGYLATKNISEYWKFSIFGSL